MNTFFAAAFSGLLLFVIGRSLFKIYKIGQTELSANDQRVALAIVAACLVASVAMVLLLLQSARG